MIAELVFVFLIPLVWGFFELRQLRRPAAASPELPLTPVPPPAPPDLAPEDATSRAAGTNQTPSKHPQQEQEE